MDLFATLSSTTEKQGQAKYLQIFMEIALVFSLTELRHIKCYRRRGE